MNISTDMARVETVCPSCKKKVVFWADQDSLRFDIGDEEEG